MTDPFNKWVVLRLKNSDPFNKHVNLTLTHIVEYSWVNMTRTQHANMNCHPYPHSMWEREREITDQNTSDIISTRRKSSPSLVTSIKREKQTKKSKRKTRKMSLITPYKRSTISQLRTVHNSRNFYDLRCTACMNQHQEYVRFTNFFL